MIHAGTESNLVANSTRTLLESEGLHIVAVVLLVLRILLLV